MRSGWIAGLSIHREIAEIFFLACSYTIFSNTPLEHYHRWMILKFGGFPLEPGCILTLLPGRELLNAHLHRRRQSSLKYGQGLHGEAPKF